MYKDKTIVCKDCGQSFTFTAREQEFFAEKGYTNEPQRCKACRDAKKASRGNNGNDRNGGQRQMYSAQCASCGCECQVPFQPREGRPVYCSECFKKMK